jgi:hypothetical protein
VPDQSSSELPDNVENTHEEAVALDSIKLARHVEGVTENLHVIDQAIILALWYDPSFLLTLLCVVCLFSIIEVYFFSYFLLFRFCSLMLIV